jgi:hypothetical protein
MSAAHSEEQSAPSLTWQAIVPQVGGNELTQEFNDAIAANDIMALRSSIVNIVPTKFTEGLGSRLMAQDFFASTKAKLEKLSENGNSGLGLRKNISVFIHDITQGAKSIINRLSYLGGSDGVVIKQEGTVATDRIKEEARRLQDDDLARFARKLADFPAEYLDGDDPATWTKYWLPETRMGIVGWLQEVRQSYLEEGYSENTRKEFNAVVKKINEELDGSSDNAIPNKENPWTSTQ